MNPVISVLNLRGHAEREAGPKIHGADDTADNEPAVLLDDSTEARPERPSKAPAAKPESARQSGVRVERLAFGEFNRSRYRRHPSAVVRAPRATCGGPPSNLFSPLRRRHATQALEPRH